MKDLAMGVVGAGAIGCYVGGVLAAAGNDVLFIGRERMKAEVDASGLALTDLEGRTVRVAPGKVAFATDVARLADRDIVLCCVKSAQTPGVAAELAGVLAKDAVVVSLQNGVGNADALRAGLEGRGALGGIVGFNVVSRGDGAFRQATSGPIVIERSPDPRGARLAAAMNAAGLQAIVASDIRARQWSKLMMNLNNAISALSDAPTKTLVFDPGYRRILREVIKEALAVLGKAGIAPARFGAIPVRLFPWMLGLPTPLLRIVARAQLKIDPEARSSMWEDLVRGRLTEVDYLNGEIVRLAAKHGCDAPLNQRVVDLVHEVERAGKGSPKLSAEVLWQELSGHRSQ